MGCVRLRQGQYTFDASAGTVTLLNMHIEPQQLTAIYRILNNGGATAKVALYQGLDPKGGEVNIVGNDTVVSLDFDTTSFDDGDTLRIDLSVGGEMLFNKQQIVANGVTDGTAVFNSEDIKSMVLFVKSDVNILVNYNRYSEQNGGGVNTPIVFPLDALDYNQGATPKFFRASFGVNDPSFSFTFTNNSGGNADVTFYVLGLFERVETTILPLSFPLTSSLALPQTRSILAAESEDGLRQRTGNITNILKGINGGLNVSLPNAIVVDYSIPPAGSIPSGAIPTIHPVLNTEPNVYDTGWYSVLGYPSGQLLNFLANQDALIYLLNASDELGANIVGDTQPFLTPTANTGTPFAAPYFDAYSRIVVVNNSGSDITALRLLAKGRQVETPAIYTQLSQPIFDLFPAPITQAVIKGKDDVTGIYNPPNTHNDSKGTSLVVAQGHRLEQVFSRTPFQKSTVVTGIVTPITGVVHTVTVGKTLYVTNLQILVVNILNGVGGNLTIQDGATVIWNYPITPATNQGKTGLDLVIPMESSPLKITDTLQFTLPAGLVGSTGVVNIKAYEEDN